jgi:P27 family predicted phage terminase small subunit
MGRKPGPVPRPTVLKIRAGVQPCRINTREPIATMGEPELPELVQADPVALAEWRRIVPILVDMSILSIADGPALCLYCMAHSRLRAATEQLRSEGLTIVSITGHEKANPLLAVVRGAADEVRRMLLELGLTPSARSSLKTGSGPPDELAEFLKRRDPRKKQGRGRRSTDG